MAENHQTFSKKAPSYMFEYVLNTSLDGTVRYYH